MWGVVKYSLKLTPTVHHSTTKKNRSSIIFTLTKKRKHSLKCVAVSKIPFVLMTYNVPFKKYTLDKVHCVLTYGIPYPMGNVSLSDLYLEPIVINILGCHELGNNLKLSSQKIHCIVMSIQAFNQLPLFVLTVVIEISIWHLNSLQAKCAKLFYEYSHYAWCKLESGWQCIMLLSTPLFLVGTSLAERALEVSL